MRKLGFIAVAVFCFTASIIAQTQEITGVVRDSVTGEPVPFVTIAALQGSQVIQSTMTDVVGIYTLKLDPGAYDVKATSVGYKPVLHSGIIVSSNRITVRDIVIAAGVTIKTVVVRHEEKIVDDDGVGLGEHFGPKQIDNAPTTSISGILKTAPGVTFGKNKNELHFFGGRADAFEVYIDNVRTIGSFNIPVTSILEMNTYSNGVPAKFGDATSGIIEIITKGPARQFGGSLDISTSQGMDAYGFTRGTFNLRGPLWLKNKNKDDERVVLGYFIAGEYLRQEDANPSAVGVYTAKKDVLNYLEQNPLTPSPVSDAFIVSTETVTADDLEKVFTKPNVEENTYSFSGKIEAKPTPYITLAVGGNGISTARHDWIDRYTLFNSVNNPFYNENTWRVYGRFRQRFGSKNSDEHTSKSATRWAIEHAYYQVQFDYSKVRNTYRDDSHGFNPFDYGYIGNFDALKQPIYRYGEDVVSGKTGWILAGYQDTLVRYAPSPMNRTGAAFTNKYYELAGGVFENGWWTTPSGGAQNGYYASLDQVQLKGGLLNGDRPRIAHDIWYNTGRQFNGYGISDDDDRYGMTLMSALDIRKGANRHSLEFGFEFEQRIERGYSVSSIGMWELMRQLANKHIDQLDTDNPYLLIDGELYSPDDVSAPAFGQNDTIVYERKYVAGSQSFFDKSLRRKLGLADDNVDFINTDAYTPDFYSLDMFSPDELLNNGNPYVAAYGYDYTGNRFTSQPSFADFFKAKDANGNFTRAVGAYRPIYSAAYVQDKFIFRSMIFNLGLRVDRFDANQKVLRDPYTLYPAYTAGEAAQRLEGDIPANIGDDFVVYVNDFNKQNPVPLGYRNGSTWYTADGTETGDPKIIAQSSSTGRITPFLVNPNDNIKSENFNPDASFTDYKPQITVMPRISFSFKLKENTRFFAHYNILTQRPQAGIFTTPDVWYFFNENINAIINNPALKPEKTIDYQIGFEQAITKRMAFTVAAYYREMRDMVQVVNVPYAYPRDYKTFGNVDFGTVKGFSFAYEMRRSEKTNFSINFNYTIQFADGTGSNSTSQVNLIGSGQPNLRTIAPLDFDSRHNINLSLDYSYGAGEEYNGPVSKKGKQILANAGINIITRANSGTPYTQQDNPTAEALNAQASRKILSGSINGSRLPWYFNADLRVWKDFRINGSSAEDATQKRSYSLSVYCIVQNVLGTANVIDVYPYTGNAGDDGYLTSAIGQQDIAGKANAQSYQDLYRAYMEGGLNGSGGSRYSLPRHIRVGAILKF